MRSPRIAIVGSGWSGMLALYHLLKIPHEKGRNPKITIFGDPDECQAKSIQVGTNLICDIGTCYLHPGYGNSVCALADEFGVTLEFPPGADMITNGVVGSLPEPGWIDNVCIVILLFHQFMWNYLRFIPYISDFLYGRSMASYLQYAGLGRLSNSFFLAAGTVSQGYGLLTDVSAHRLFEWLDVGLFATKPLQKLLGTGTGMIKGGYGTMFRRILNQLITNDDVQTDTRKVRYVRDHGHVELDDGTQQQFDDVIVCCPLDAVQTPVGIGSRDMSYTLAYSFLWTSEQKCPGIRHRVYDQDTIEHGDRRAMLTFRYEGQTDGGDHVYWGFGSDGSFGPDDDHQVYEREIQEAFTRDCAKHGVPVKKVLFQKVFVYNPRLSIKAIRNGRHRAIDRANGINGIWYLGGMIAHWDVDSIYENAKRTVDKLQRTGKKRLPA
jgi:hypothetical protein